MFMFDNCRKGYLIVKELMNTKSHIIDCSTNTLVGIYPSIIVCITSDLIICHQDMQLIIFFRRTGKQICTVNRYQYDIEIHEQRLCVKNYEGTYLFPIID